MSVNERYLSATNSGNLKLKLDAPCDADALLAAGYASGGDPRKSLALRLWRMRQTGQHGGYAGAVNDCIELIGVGPTHGHKVGQRRVRDIVEKTLFWWLNPVCSFCDGLGHPVLPGTPNLDYSRTCEACGGVGIAVLEDLVHASYAQHARRLADDLDRLSVLVFSDMARLLSTRMEFED